MCQHRSREPDQRAKGPLEFVHCDLAGPVEPAAKDGFKYALSFVDDFTDTNLMYFLKVFMKRPKIFSEIVLTL
jgi:hypothetical protein